MIEVKAALELRRACARFRRDLEKVPPGASRAELLDAAASSLARLSDRAARAGLPAGAAEGIRGLHDDILDWLRQHGNPGSAPGDDPAGPTGLAGDAENTGLRLWTELCGLSVLLWDLSHTEEVMGHDRALIEQVQGELDRIPSGTQTVPPVIRVLLDGLFGRDDELDDLLGQRDRVARFELEPILDRIALDELDQAAGGGGGYGYGGEGETIH